MSDPNLATVAEPLTAADGAIATKTTEASLLDQILNQGLRVSEKKDRDKATDWLDTLLREVLPQGQTVSAETDVAINTKIAQIDKMLTDQVNEIMHTTEYQKLEASWRGLKYLVFQTETSPMLKIKVLNISRKELLKDLRDATEFDQSAMFKKIYEEGYGQLGAHPFAVLVGDFEFSRLPEDIEILSKMSNVAAAAHAPFISGTSSDMFGLESFTDINAPRDLAKIFDNDFYIDWRTFRETEDSRYVGLVLPHILMRLPYGKKNIQVDAFDFEEDVTGKDHKKYCWGNAVYALATRITDAFARYEWCAAIRGVEGGGLVEGLPLHTFESEDGDPTKKIPTEVAIPSRRDAEISGLGFIPCVYYQNTNSAVFIETHSVQKPTVYYDNDATANADLSARLQYIFATCRFAHYIQAMMYDKIGSFMTREQCETFLDGWIKNYILLDDNATQEQKARFPLREAQVQVTEVPGKPGAYTAIVHLRPHFQLEELKLSLRLVAKLPQMQKQ